MWFPHYMGILWEGLTFRHSADNHNHAILDKNELLFSFFTFDHHPKCQSTLNTCTFINILKSNIVLRCYFFKAKSMLPMIFFKYTEPITGLVELISRIWQLTRPMKHETVNGRKLSLYPSLPQNWITLPCNLSGQNNDLFCLVDTQYKFLILIWRVSMGRLHWCTTMSDGCLSNWYIMTGSNFSRPIIQGITFFRRDRCRDMGLK